MGNNAAKVLGTTAIWFGIAAIAYVTAGTVDSDTVRSFLVAGGVGTFFVWYFGASD